MHQIKNPFAERDWIGDFMYINRVNLRQMISVQVLRERKKNSENEEKGHQWVTLQARMCHHTLDHRYPLPQ